MPNDPYINDLLKQDVYVRKTSVIGRIVAVLKGHLEQRTLELIPQPSRAVSAGDVHELIMTDESGACPGRRVEHIAYLGFVEFENGGILLAGDEATTQGRSLGVVVGFDVTHAPNHLNVVIRSSRAMSGEDLGLELGAPVIFTMVRHCDPEPN